MSKLKQKVQPVQAARYRPSKSFIVLMTMLLGPIVLVLLVSGAVYISQLFEGNTASQNKVGLAKQYAEVTLPNTFTQNSGRWEPGSLDVSQEWTYEYSTPDDQKTAYQKLQTSFETSGYQIIPFDSTHAAPQCKEVKFSLNAVNASKNIQAYATFSSTSPEALSGGDCTTSLLAPQKITVNVHEDWWSKNE